MTRKNILIVFSRYPAPGKVKTRLIPAIGPEQAAMVQRRMTEDTMMKVRGLTALLPVTIKVFYTGGSTLEMADWLGEFDFVEQVSGDLGHKMAAAFTQLFKENNENIVIIGTDCPSLSGEILQEAFLSLAENDLVLGPAIDGGYYLLGLSRKAPFLFTNMPWGSGEVFAATRRRAELHKMKLSCLDTLADIDRPEDLTWLDGFSR